MGQVRGTLDAKASCTLVQELAQIPGKLEQVLANSEIYEELVEAPVPRHRIFFTSAAASTSPSRSKAR